MELTQELVKSLFVYKDGIFYWKIKRKKANCIKIGDIAGSISHSNRGVEYDRWIISFNGKNYKRSRIVFLWHHGYLPEMVDHINTNPLDDNIENLRESTRGQNGSNRNASKKSTSKYLGVCLNGKKWRSQIKSEKKVKYLGTFETQEQAALTYNRAAVFYHKEFANLNIITS